MSHTARLVPVYPETRGLTSRGIRFVTQTLFKKHPVFKEWIPRTVLAETGFPELNDAIHAIHFPRSIEDAHAARARFSSTFSRASWPPRLPLSAANAPVETPPSRVKNPCLAASAGTLRKGGRVTSQIPAAVAPQHA